MSSIQVSERDVTISGNCDIPFVFFHFDPGMYIEKSAQLEGNGYEKNDKDHRDHI